MPQAETLARLRRDSPTRPVVVLAIDDEDRRATYAYAISAAGFDVMTSDRGATVLADRFAPRPDIVVADVSAGSRHGWTFVQGLKRDGRTAKIPVIAIAADVGAGTRARARRERCAAVCPKTCPADIVAAGIRQVLKSLG